MPLEFPADLLTPLHLELGLQKWIQSFHRAIPILGKTLLRPLLPDAAAKHFKDLRELSVKLNAVKLKTEDLLCESQNLPSLDVVFNALRNQSMEQVDYHRLGAYLSHELRLLQWEKKLAENDQSTNLVEHLLAILDQFLEDNFGALRLSAQLLKKQQLLLRQREEIGLKIEDLEEKILKATNLGIRYGYPRHFNLTDETMLKSLEKLAFIDLNQEGGKWVACLKLTPELLNLEDEIQKLEQSLGFELNQLLGKLNQKVELFLQALEGLYQQRRQKTLSYLLLATSERLNLTIPRLCEEKKMCLVDGRLPITEEYTREYVPLNLELHAGANLLVGANMSGKTTILKTIFFMATLVQFGLPVPAQDLEMHFPNAIFCHLPGTGDIRKNLSAFGAELEFWTTPFPANTFILIDEMFHSTDPISGVFFTRVFTEECQVQNQFLLATTHFNEVLNLKNTVFFRMLSNGKAERFEPSRDPLKGLDTQALESALNFSLPTSVKNKIRKRLKSLKLEAED